MSPTAEPFVIRMPLRSIGRRTQLQFASSDETLGLMDNAGPRVVVLGAGFGGLTFCQHFKCRQCQITLVDRQNHHLFQPLLYQVAAAGLAAPDIAQPIRSILHDQKNLTVLLDTVTGFDLAQKVVHCQENELPYDYLVLALGGATSYFGHPEWEQNAPGLKSLDDALRIRRRILLAFEQAENATDPEVRKALMTIVVVGGGPTGVELAGAFAELARHVLEGDFRRIHPRQARVILIEASPQLLSHFPADLGASARAQLTRLGVEVRTGVRVKNLTRGCVELENEVILAENVIWAAGVSANPLTKQLGVPIDRAGRIKVNPDLSLPGHPEVFGIGDLAFIIDKDGQTVPGVSPAAMQMAKHVAKVIEDDISLGSTSRPAFDYWDRGTMATIGRSAAVAQIGRFQFSGFPAWLAWLVVHLIFLVGFRNKIAVFFNWVYSYFTYKRGMRIITGLSEDTVVREKLHYHRPSAQEESVSQLAANGHETVESARMLARAPQGQRVLPRAKPTK